MEPVSRISVVDYAAAQLRDMIANGEWALGQRIPSESELAELLGMSRASVRTATRSLIEAGLLEARQGAGTFVVETNESGVALKRWLQDALVHETNEVRDALEVLAARLAAQRRDEGEVQTMAALLEARREALRAGEFDAFVEADLHFHLAIGDAAHNTVLRELYRSLSPSLRATIARNQDKAGFQAGNADDEHDVLMAALRDGDPDAAGAAVVRMLGVLEES